ncbi:hypothetical protein CVT26_009005, partial [Gymnopilus dilepis]
AFYGEIGAANFSTTVAELTNLIIDNRAPSSASVDEQGTDTLFYQTPTLHSGSHNVTFFTFSNVNFDFFVITAANDTDLSGQTLIVDDSDSSIVYSGDWSKNSSVLAAATNSRTPYGGSFHQTNAAGAAATFSFTGNSVSVHGVANTGPMSITFTVDGLPVPATQFADSNGSLNPTFTWYSSDSLSPADHTLQMKVGPNPGASFSIDYILYKPAFSTLASKPVPNSATSGVPSSSNSSPTDPPTTTGQHQGEQTSGGNITPTTKPSAAVIVGSVIGGLAFVLLVVLILWVWRRRRLSRLRRVSLDLISDDSTSIPTPFPPPSVLYFDERKNASPASTTQNGWPPLSRGLTDDTTGPSSSAPSSASLGRVDPFPLAAEHRENFPQSKASLLRLDASQNPQSYPSPGHVAETSRVHELVTELQQELEASGARGRDELLRQLLHNGSSSGAGAVVGDNPQDDRSRRESAAPSTLPPPYEAGLDAQATATRRPTHSRKVG